MKRFASCSFGKDSLAATVVEIERGGYIDAAVYCRIMFDNETSAELPEHEEWIFNHAIPLLKSRYGIDTEIVQANVTYTDCFYRKFERGKREGTIYGWPFLRGPWCNSRLKRTPIDAWAKTAGEHEMIVGIACDEVKRIEKKTVEGKILPLVDEKITEMMAFDIAKKADLLSPAYNGDRTRLGCWFCHNQRLSELRRLRNEYPELWLKLLEIDSDSPVTFRAGSKTKPGATVRKLDDRFFNETAQITVFEYLKELEEQHESET